MAPSAVVEHVILDNALVTQKVEILPLEERAPKPEVVRSVKPAFEFSKAVLLEQNPMRTGSKTLDVAVAVMLHVIVIATPILLGLFYTDTININTPLTLGSGTSTGSRFGGRMRRAFGWPAGRRSRSR